ncbi:MAG: hypothetical protein QNJ12_17400 [Ilumatobacter sp.]|uniref:hypothetical protein n=1 Tax=Ilumatobacter sp. TaxID=1967498 RepID=UPI00262A509B|nr:hypothetical protein [Ilumatobacter sp.]MDJ0770574.1 hypothetical protein [Ilumatobacter sp.]
MSNLLRAVVVTATVALGLAIAPASVEAGVGASAVPSFPSVITLGDTGVTASIVLRNQNTVDADGDDTRSNTICNAGDAFPCPAGGEGITLVPSCGVVAAPTACDPTGADAGVFVLGPTATGSAAGGSECGGIDFTVALIDPVFGKYRFTPTAGNVTLSQRDAFCQIDFTYNVVKKPTIDQDPGQPGVQTAQVVANTQIVEVGSPNRSVPGSGSGTSVRTIRRVVPSITTTASPGTQLGGAALSDTAVVSGRFDPQPGATVDFSLYGPDDADCSGAPVFTSLDVEVPVDSDTVTSASFTPTAPGTYRWVAVYRGDANNRRVSGACGDAGETVEVGRATPTIVTTASPDTGLGSDLTDVATVSGRFDPQPGATVDFRLYGPDDADCSGPPAFETLGVAYPVDGGAVSSGAFTPTEPGVYRWVAAYSGDANNAPAIGACGESSETTEVTRGTPAITTAASAGVVIGGGALTDSATVLDRVNPVAGGTVDFRLYGPDDADCSGAPVFESLAVPYPVAGGAVSSQPFTPTAPGTYRWVASYSGDANNAPVSGACNDPGESTVVSKATPSITTNASASVQVGAGVLTDRATVTGRVDPQPGATITFRLYGPDDATCAQAPIFESAPVPYPVAGGTVTSPPFTPVAAGLYRWRAFYSGDANNAAVSGVCNAANETTLVTPRLAQELPATGATTEVLIGTAVSLVVVGVALMSGARRPAPLRARPPRRRRSP